jgi:hypothetical protein
MTEIYLMGRCFVGGLISQGHSLPLPDRLGHHLMFGYFEYLAHFLSNHDQIKYTSSSAMRVLYLNMLEVFFECCCVESWLKLAICHKGPCADGSGPVPEKKSLTHPSRSPYSRPQMRMFLLTSMPPPPSVAPNARRIK